MYASQAAAFNTAAEFAPRVTDSTPEMPPTFIPVNMEGLANAKRDAIKNLPATCPHCTAAVPRGDSGGKPCFVERDSGQIFMYCFGPGGCGRSHIMFTLPKDVHLEPVYAKVPCMFAAVPKPPQPTNASGHPLNPDGTIDYRALHGMQDSDETCAKCDKPRKEHQTGFDTNGWRVADHKHVPFPASWPTWNGKWWTNVD